MKIYFGSKNEQLDEDLDVFLSGVIKKFKVEFKLEFEFGEVGIVLVVKDELLVKDEDNVVVLKILDSILDVNFFVEDGVKLEEEDIWVFVVVFKKCKIKK